MDSLLLFLKVKSSKENSHRLVVRLSVQVQGVDEQVVLAEEDAGAQVSHRVVARGVADEATPFLHETV